MAMFSIYAWTNKNYQQSFNALIRKVIVNNKQILFEGNYGEVAENFPADVANFLVHQNKKDIHRLEYAKNALSFEFAATFYEKLGSTVFQCKLEDFDKEWCDWYYPTTKEYTNIPEGHYAFQVRAKNLYDTIGQDAQYYFVILPSWYRTI